MRVNRRGFIKVLAAGGGGTFVPGLFPACSDRASEAFLAWSGPGPVTAERDPRWIALCYAILAANPHNTQPWLVELLEDQAFDLYVDPSRLLPRTDPRFRQTHIGQGSFLENADLAARQLGYRAEIEYFPLGSYGESVVEPKPVARVRLLADPSIERDPLFAFLLERESNKRVYDGSPLRAAELRALGRACDSSDYPLALVDSPVQVEPLAELMWRAMEVEVADVQRNRETLEWFRFDSREIELHRDGFGVAQTGMSGPMKWIAESFFLSRERSQADPGSFASEAVKLTARQASSAPAYGWITSTANTRLDQVRVGRAYQRMNLAATAHGLAIGPMTQVLEEYPAMSALRQEFLEIAQVPPGHTVQMLFRLGRAQPVAHTPRRPVADLIRA